MATRESKATRQGFMGLRSLRLAGFKTLFAGSRRQNLCVHMATRDSQLPGSGHHGQGVPASKPSKATRQGFMGLRSLRLAGKTLFRGVPARAHGYKGLSGHQARFYGPSKLAFGRLQNPFRGVPASKPSPPHGHQARSKWPGLKSLFAGLPGSKATRQGFTRFYGSSKLAFGRLQNPFRGARPQNLHMHMATRESKATRQGFMGLRSLRLAGFKTLFAGSRRQNLCVHMATRDSQLPGSGHHRQGFMGLGNLRLAGFKTLFAGPGLKTFTCTWPQGSQRPPGKVLWAFEACVWPASKPFSRGPGVKTCSCTWLHDPQATRQGFMGLRSLRLAGFKTLFAGSRPQNLRMHMANSSSQPASKPSHAHGYKGL